jgi:hypothetical protein
MTRLAAALVVLVVALACAGPTVSPDTSPATSPSSPSATVDCSPYSQSAVAELTPGFDPVLEGLFPPSIDGHALHQPVSSGSLIASLCSQASDPSYAQEFADHLPAGWNFGSLTNAAAQYDFPELPYLLAVRAPGEQGLELFNAVSTMPDANGLADAPVQEVGGKQASVLTDQSEQNLYIYATGEVLFLVENASDSDAAAILAALP